MNSLNVIKGLCNLSPRQGKKEIESAKYLGEQIKYLPSSFKIQRFSTQVPIVTSAYLRFDGKNIDCLGCSFETGKITGKSQIYFSHHSDHISTPNYYQTPSVSISRLDQEKLKQAKEVDGQVIIEKYSYLSQNFLIGNTDNPKIIIFTHYDSLWGGAIDNAGGVSVCLKLISDNPSLTKDNLFVFAGNEELSYDFPNYWGYGYRQFEKNYLPQLHQAMQIIVVDGVGLTSPDVITEDLDSFLPLKNLEILQNKIKAISSKQSEVLKCYHCQEDTPEKISLEYLNHSQNLIAQMLE